MSTQKTVVPIVRPITEDQDDLLGQIAVVRNNYPDLSAYGFHFAGPDDWDEVNLFRRYRAHMETPDFSDQVLTCLEALAAPRSRRHAWKLERHSSYVLKHAVERWAEESKRDDVARYVSNGAFIVAAVIDGWQPIRLERSPNCRFSRGAH